MISGKAKQRSSPYAQKPWLEHYDYWVPGETNFPRQTIYQMLNLAAAHFGERPATVFLGSEMSFAELLAGAGLPVSDLRDHQRGLPLPHQVGLDWDYDRSTGGALVTPGVNTVSEPTRAASEGVAGVGAGVATAVASDVPAGALSGSDSALSSADNASVGAVGIDGGADVAGVGVDRINVDSSGGA